MTQEERDAAVGELVELIGIVGGVLCGQSTSDANYFAQTCGRNLNTSEVSQTRQFVLNAYRPQYIPSGTRHPRFKVNSTDPRAISYNILMNTRFDGITEFVAIARLGSFTAAAAELGVTKSSVARAASRLETRLGAKLLHRTTRRLTLTRDGEAWLEHCIAVLDELDRGEDALSVSRHDPAGQVRIDLPSAFGRLFVMPRLLDLAGRFPELMLNVSFSDGFADLIGEGIEVAVRIGTINDTSDLVARRIGEQTLVICGSVDYFAARGMPQTAADLVDHDCIVGSRHRHEITWILKQPDGSIVHHLIRAKHEIHDYEMMLSAVKSGRGLAQLPCWLAEDGLRGGLLVTVLNGMSGGELPINILWPRTRTLPARIRVVVDEIVQLGRGFMVLTNP